jgi:hypothetical protein
LRVKFEGSFFFFLVSRCFFVLFFFRESLIIESSQVSRVRVFLVIHKFRSCDLRKGKRNRICQKITLLG